MPRKLNGSHVQGSNELISRFIYELTGEIRNRKQISSHIQHIKTIGSHMSRLPTKLTQQMIETATALREADFGDTSLVYRHIRCIQNAANVLARRSRTHSKPKRSMGASTRVVKSIQPPIAQSADSLFCRLSRLASVEEHRLVIRPTHPFDMGFLNVTLTNRQIRAEALQFQESKFVFDIQDDIETLHVFCETLTPSLCQRIRYIHLESIEGRTQHLSTISTSPKVYLETSLPTLQTLFVSLVPRDPTIEHSHYPPRWGPNTSRPHEDSRWGSKTSAFLAELSRMKMTVVLSLRWDFDCEFFEKEYVIVRWQCMQVGEADYIWDCLWVYPMNNLKFAIAVMA